MVYTNRSAWKTMLNEASETVMMAVAEQMLADSLYKIPMEEGSLRASGRVESDAEGVFLSWTGVYAAYQWYGMRIDGTHVVRNYTTSGTGKLWVEEARAQNQAKWHRVAQNAMEAWDQSASRVFIPKQPVQEVSLDADFLAKLSKKIDKIK